MALFLCEELKIGLLKTGSHLAESKMQVLIEAVDNNGKGVLDYGGFFAPSRHLQRMANDEHLDSAFSHFDKDGNDKRSQRSFKRPWWKMELLTAQIVQMTRIQLEKGFATLFKWKIQHVELWTQERWFSKHRQPFCLAL